MTDDSKPVCQYCCGWGWTQDVKCHFGRLPRETYWTATTKRCGWCNGTGKLEPPKSEEEAQ